MAEQISRADIVLVAELVRFCVYDGGTRPESTLRIREFLHGESLTKGHPELAIGQSVILATEAAGKPGDLFLMYGLVPSSASVVSLNTFATEDHSGQTEGGTSRSEITRAMWQPTEHSDAGIQKSSMLVPELISWNETLAISEDMCQYLRQLPAQSEPQAKRLEFFLSCLEDPDPLIAIDAWAEFGNSSYEDVVAVRHQMSQQKLRDCIADEDMSPERLGLYGMMLGLSGSVDDADFLLSQMMCTDSGARDDRRRASDFRFGSEGLMGGYLLLTGERGLQQLETTVVRSGNASDSVLNAFVLSLQFIWTYESDIISKERIEVSMQDLLHNPTMREIAIINLCRWEHWESLPTLTAMFSKECADDRSTQRAILQFAQSCQRSLSARSAANDFASQAEEFLCEVHAARPDLLSSNTRDFHAPQ